MAEVTLFILALGITIHELRETLKDLLCANKEMKLSFEIKSKK